MRTCAVGCRHVALACVCVRRSNPCMQSIGGVYLLLMPGQARPCCLCCPSFVAWCRCSCHCITRPVGPTARPLHPWARITTRQPHAGVKNACWRWLASWGSLCWPAAPRVFVRMCSGVCVGAGVCVCWALVHARHACCGPCAPALSPDRAQQPTQAWLVWSVRAFDAVRACVCVRV